jgi:vancomycin resistance protein YoaR
MRILPQETSFHFKGKAFLLGVVFAFIGVGIGGTLWLTQQYQDRMIEGIVIDGVNVSKMTKPEALLAINNAPPSPFAVEMITLKTENASIASSAAQLGLHRSTESIVDQAYMVGRSNSIIENIQTFISSYFSGRSLQSTLAYEPEKVQEFVTLLATQAYTPDQKPSMNYSNKVVNVFAGKYGRSIQIEETVTQILSSPSDTGLVHEFSAQLITIGTELNDAQIANAKARGEKYIGKTVEGKVDVITSSFSDSELISMLGVPEGYNEEKVTELLDQIKTKVDRPARNAEFVFDPNTLKVSTFVADQDGLTINSEQTREKLFMAMKQIEAGTQDTTVSFEVVVAAKKADVTLASLNNLGINERIGFGESFYDHSIPTRIHNVSQASKIVNNTIVKPGEEFSFNKTLGDVSKATGFQPAYVIKSGQTVLGDGGGVCQVSTTLFRALLDSGLNITKRKPHSYRVSYYELNKDPGFDATVYAGDVDLRFINDSPGAVLLHFETFPDTKYMFVTIYGTSDGRTTEISGYKKWDVRGAPASQYFDDPTLPPGKLVQIDWAVGGIKTQFTHTVKDKNGNVIRENTYYSNYIPWAAKYRRGV